MYNKTTLSRVGEPSEPSERSERSEPSEPSEPSSFLPSELLTENITPDFGVWWW